MPQSQTTSSSDDLFSELGFDSLDLPDALSRGIHEAGFERLTRIQARTLPVSLAGKDVAAQSQTGTGKTATFLITVYARLLADPDRPPRVPAALVIAPTRELALQIHADAEAIGGQTGIVSAAIYGGMDYDRQERALRNGVDLVIGTPGRLKDYLRRGVLKLDQVRIVVIDEADRMFDMGFIKDIRFMLRRVPPPGERQAMLFSATLGQRIQELAYEHMHEPVKIEVRPDQVAAQRAEQLLYHVSVDEKFPLLLGLLKRDPPHRAIIFANTKNEVARLHHRLSHNGFEIEMLTSDLTQQRRLAIVKRFKAGELPMVVATDVASRGIHVEGVSHVINYDLPQDAEDYVHRIGRTARVGEAGKAISLACERFVFSLEAIEELIGEKIDVEWPGEGMLEEDRSPPYRPPRRDGDRRGGPGGSRGGGGRGAPRSRHVSAPVRRAPEGERRSSGPSEAGAEERRSRRPRRRRSDDGSAPAEGEKKRTAPAGDDAAAGSAPPARKRRPRRRRRSGSADGEGSGSGSTGSGE